MMGRVRRLQDNMVAIEKLAQRTVDALSKAVIEIEESKKQAKQAQEKAAGGQED